jgi:class 3 adenylate cyclase
MITAKAGPEDIVAGLEAGAEEYLTKPVDQVALVARVRSMLRIKELHDTVQAQAAALADWNRTLEERVNRQVAELERVGRLRRFLAPQVADAIISSSSEAVLDSHRREVTVVFCDLRGFTPFAETAEPEELLGVLRAYHEALGQLVHRFAGTLERFAGDGLMVFFNDPLPQPDHAARAVRMAAAMRRRVEELAVGWRQRGHELGFGIGVATGYATLGRIGFEGRSDYACLGPVTNLAARLCAAATPGQILLSQRVLAAVPPVVALEVERVPDPELRGVLRPAPVYNLLQAQEVEGALPAGPTAPDGGPATGHGTPAP